MFFEHVCQQFSLSVLLSFCLIFLVLLMKVLLIKRKACIYTVIYKHNIKTYFNSIHQHINRKAKFFQKKNRNTCLSETSISLYILIDIYKPSLLLTLIISAGVIFQIFGAKYLNVVKPYLSYILLQVKSLFEIEVCIL